jgi:hypothetical protein
VDDPGGGVRRQPAEKCLNKAFAIVTLRAGSLSQKISAPAIPPRPEADPPGEPLCGPSAVAACGDPPSATPRFDTAFPSW